MRKVQNPSEQPAIYLFPDSWSQKMITGKRGTSRACMTDQGLNHAQVYVLQTPFGSLPSA